MLQNRNKILIFLLLNVAVLVIMIHRSSISTDFKLVPVEDEREVIDPFRDISAHHILEYKEENSDKPIGDQIHQTKYTDKLTDKFKHQVKENIDKRNSDQIHQTKYADKLTDKHKHNVKENDVGDKPSGDQIHQTKYTDKLNDKFRYHIKQSENMFTIDNGDQNFVNEINNNTDFSDDSDSNRKSSFPNSFHDSYSTVIRTKSLNEYKDDYNTAKTVTTSKSLDTYANTIIKPLPTTAEFNASDLPNLKPNDVAEKLDRFEFKALMRRRQKLLKRSCQKIFFMQRVRPKQNRLPFVKSQHYYALQNQSIVWCPVFKAASTTWMYNMIQLTGRNQSQIEALREIYPRQPNQQLRSIAPFIPTSSLKVIAGRNDSASLIVVRHPFERLVSAFRDKLERCHGPADCNLDKDWYYKTYGRTIVKKYRKSAIRRFSLNYFHERNNYGSPVPVEGSWRSADLPSWWEFVQFLLSKNPLEYDEHWRPMSLYCSYCSFPFNYILHTESIVQEEAFFLDEFGRKDLVVQKWQNKYPQGYTAEELVAIYFSILDDDDIQKLYNIYEDDFISFGYSFRFRGIDFNSI